MNAKRNGNGKAGNGTVGFGWAGYLAVVAALAVSMAPRYRAMARFTNFEPTSAREMAAARAAAAIEPVSFSTRWSELISPDGLAPDPSNGSILVVEEDRARVIRFDRNGERSVVLNADTPVYERTPAGYVAAVPLRSPEGIARDAHGSLYVAEDIPGGRLIVYTIGPDGRASHGDVEPLPLPAHAYAWESVAVGPRGEVLLAGSSAESTTQGGALAPFEGVLLYRDSAGQWWMPYRRPFAAFSAAALSADGCLAYYACEFSGEVGAVDLTSRTLRSWASSHRFQSPEGLCALPDGTLLVAEEGGRILRLDPEFDEATVVAETGTSIESIAFSADRAELLATADREGLVLACDASAPQLASCTRTSAVNVTTGGAQTFVPGTCPPYLKKVLAMAGFDADSDRAACSFAELARRLSLVAVDARATLIHSARPVDDPLTHVQFAVFAPQLLGFDLSGLLGPSSAFVARHASGRLVRTEQISRALLRADVMAGTVVAMGSEAVAVPYPFGARLAETGVASIHFAGMGHTPDYSFVVNPNIPGESYLLVTPPDGNTQQYRLELPVGLGREHWVIGTKQDAADSWARLHHPAFVPHPVQLTRAIAIN